MKTIEEFRDYVREVRATHCGDAIIEYYTIVFSSLRYRNCYVLKSKLAKKIRYYEEVIKNNSGYYNEGEIFYLTKHFRVLTKFWNYLMS